MGTRRSKALIRILRKRTNQKLFSLTKMRRKRPRRTSSKDSKQYKKMFQLLTYLQANLSNTVGPTHSPYSRIKADFKETRF